MDGWVDGIWLNAAIDCIYTLILQDMSIRSLDFLSA